MPPRTKSQPYRLDWQPAKDIQEANGKLSKLWIAADSMVEILFRELKRIGTISVDESTFEKVETGSDADVLTHTVGAADEFLVIQVAVDVSTFTGTSIVSSVRWKDGNNAAATSSVALTGIGNGTINIPINAKAATNVVVSTVFVGTSTTYKISAFITRLR